MSKSSQFYQLLKSGYKKSPDIVQIFYVVLLVVMGLSLFFLAVTGFASLLIHHPIYTVLGMVAVALAFSLYFNVKGR